MTAPPPLPPPSENALADFAAGLALGMTHDEARAYRPPAEAPNDPSKQPLRPLASNPNDPNDPSNAYDHPGERLEQLGTILPQLIEERKTLIVLLHTDYHQSLNSLSILSGLSVPTVSNILKKAANNG